MDGKDSLSSSNFPSFFLQNRDSFHAPLHGSHAGFHSPNPSPQFTPFQLETQPANQVSPSGDQQVRRKRGRPRKYGPEGKNPLRNSEVKSKSFAQGNASISVQDDEQKKKRGRPPGTGRKQQLASLGEWFAGSAGTGFTPHVILIHPDEDVVSKIMSFSNQGPRAICVLSANGSVSTVTLCQSESSRVVTYEGLFEILSLSGSYLLMESEGSRTRSGGLSITLAGPDGRVLGGILGGLLIASTTIQVVVGSFLYGSSKPKTKIETKEESVTPNQDDNTQTGTNTGTNIGTVQNQNISFFNASDSWQDSRLMGMRNSSIDINLTRRL
ncbi:hypothetical protein LUZ60_012119 [Juncus effusus]|nr:hypothetical protein LUZ60_012119 [Juncus effusus]